ncbi:MAG: thioesterase family protein [Rhodospirillales bacterium]
MKPTLVPGLTFSHTFTVTEAKTVPALYPESPDFAAMPAVFATGFMVGFIEWACLLALKPHLDDGEGSLGVRIDVDHRAATPPGMAVTAEVEVTAVEGRKVAFTVQVRDDAEIIAEGRHERVVADWDRFNARLEKKAARR